jgi:methionyl aminopeptidase
MFGNRARHRRVPRKSPEELQKMAAAGAITAEALQAVVDAVAVGVSSLELDKIAEDVIRRAGAVPSFKGYRGYPATLCVEFNDVVVHGIPSADQIVRAGDVLGIDIGAYYQGFHGDMATTVAVGEVGEEARKLMQVAEESVWLGIEKAVAGGVLGDISRAIEEHVTAHGFSCVRDLIGHGIGQQMHEPPEVPNFYDPAHFADYDLKLRPGMTLAIEPMVNAGGFELKLDRDQWTMRTADGRLSVHYEHTVAITKDGPVVLTCANKADQVA